MDKGFGLFHALCCKANVLIYAYNDDKSSVTRHFNCHKHSVRELQYMGIETVKISRRGSNGDRITLQ